MLSLLVLFTAFLGLVGILALSEHCRRARKGRERGRQQTHQDNMALLTAWLGERGHSLPSPGSVVDLLNRVAGRAAESEDWRCLEVTGLLPETELPQFLVTKITQQTSQHIEFQLAVEWPMCLPGVGVRLERREGEGEEVMCELQVDWMYAEATVRLTDSGGLLLSYGHSRVPQMALSCLVTTEGMAEPEALASSVAHTLQLMFYDLSLTNEPLTTTDQQQPHLQLHLQRKEQEEEEGNGEREEETSQSSEPLQTNSLPTNHIYKPTPVVISNHSNHTPSNPSAHQEKPRPTKSDSDLSVSTTVTRERENKDEAEKEKEEREGEREERGDELVQNGPTISSAVAVVSAQSPSRKVWERESDGVRVSETGETSEGVKEGEGEGVRGEAVEGEEVGGVVEEASETAATEVERTEQVAAAVTITDNPPDNLPLLQTTHSNKSPPTKQKLPEHPSPLTTHTHSTQSTTPTHSSWRRSPSYEKLQEFTLPSVQEGGVANDDRVQSSTSPNHWRKHGQSVIMRGVRGEGGEEGEEGPLLSPTMSLDRRKRQALSMSGSAYSVESGADEMYPSTLVFEISDSHRTRHIVALSQAHASKLRKRVSHARKLHIYNDHIFVATHLKQRFYCHVCKKKIMGFMGKQGYVCRDCNMVVHKQCHYKTEGQCANSKLPTMNLIYPDSVSTISGL